MKISSNALSRAASTPNEDSFVADEPRGLFLVSDGVGSHGDGEIASRLVVDTAAKALSGTPPAGPADVKPWFIKAVKTAAKALHERGQTGNRDMCCTLTTLTLAANAYHIVHVGDSRAYLLRDGQLTRLTRDHSVAQEQLDAGAITEEQMQSHPNQRLLTRTIAASRDYALPEIYSGPAKLGDVFLVCTDGVNKVLMPRDIAAALRTPGGPEAKCTALLDAVDAKGRQDDTTTIVVAVME